MSPDGRFPLFLAHGQDVLMVIHGIEVLLGLSILGLISGMLLSRKSSEGARRLGQKINITSVIVFGITLPLWLLTFF
jgi:hypothetical protein